MNYPKILIGFPTSSAKDYCFEDFVKQITSFTYPLYDIFVVDNSKDKNHIKEFHKRGIKAVHEPINGDFREELARHQNIIREYFLNGDYDYLMMIESDVFTGECILEKLVSYAVRSEKILERSHGYDIMGQGVLPLNQLLVDPDAKITATGIGCTLFRREALELVYFRVDLDLNKRAFSDTFIYTDMQKLGFKILIDSNIICEHRK